MTAQPDKAVLTALLDQLIPPNPERKIPGAGALGLADPLIAKVELAGAISALLACMEARPGEMTPAYVRQLEADQPNAFQLVMCETYKAYYSRPDMRAKLGLGAHPVHPNGYAVAPEPADQLARLTAPVRARGQMYRDPAACESHHNGT